jgi:hypothetical protein
MSFEFLIRPKWKPASILDHRIKWKDQSQGLKNVIGFQDAQSCPKPDAVVYTKPG